jgi:PHS family inorganic phosphate transporter-like MFS transporter
MKIYAFFMLLGCFTTLLIPETKRLTLEQLAGEAADTASGINGQPESAERKPELEASKEEQATPV